MIEEFKPRGHITITNDNTGEIVLDTHNLIVLSGRKLIAEAVFNGTGLSTTNFSMFFQSNTNVQNTAETVYDDISDDLITGNVEDMLTYTAESPVYVGTAPKCTFQVKLSPLSNYYKINSVGLLVNGNTLFSRAIITPRHLKYGYTYTCKYEIYF